MTHVFAHDIRNKPRTNDVLISENVDFAGLLLSDSVLEGLSSSGFKRPSPIQLKAIPLGRCGLDLIVQAKSGTGKTCVFTVIALEMLQLQTGATQVLVLAPTREIAVQIWEVMQSISSKMVGVACHMFIGGLPVHEDKQKLKRCHIAIGTPGRIKQLIENDLLKTESMRLFVLDEADKLLEDSFQEQINWIYWSLPENKQMLALSATYPEYMARHLTVYMRNPTFVRLNSDDPALLGIKQYYKSAKFNPFPHKVFEEKTKVLIELLSSVSFHQCLVFSNLQTRAQNLCDILNKQGWPSECIAGCLEQEQRLAAMEKLKSFKCRILISTDLTSRGIDAEKVNLIVNLDLPYDHETYLHRIGRAGRFGSFGAAVTLVSGGEEMSTLKSVEEKCHTCISPLPDPIPTDLVDREVSIDLSRVISTEQIITREEGIPSITGESEVRIERANTLAPAFEDGMNGYADIVSERSNVSKCGSDAPNAGVSQGMEIAQGGKQSPQISECVSTAIEDTNDSLNLKVSKGPVELCEIASATAPQQNSAAEVMITEPRADKLVDEDGYKGDHPRFLASGMEETILSQNNLRQNIVADQSLQNDVVNLGKVEDVKLIQVENADNSTVEQSEQNDSAVNPGKTGDVKVVQAEKVGNSVVDQMEQNDVMNQGKTGDLEVVCVEGVDSVVKAVGNPNKGKSKVESQLISERFGSEGSYEVLNTDMVVLERPSTDGSQSANASSGRESVERETLNSAVMSRDESSRFERRADSLETSLGGVPRQVQEQFRTLSIISDTQKEEISVLQSRVQNVDESVGNCSEKTKNLPNKPVRGKTKSRFSNRRGAEKNKEKSTVFEETFGGCGSFEICNTEVVLLERPVSNKKNKPVQSMLSIPAPVRPMLSVPAPEPIAITHQQRLTEDRKQQSSVVSNARVTVPLSGVTESLRYLQNVKGVVDYSKGEPHSAFEESFNGNLCQQTSSAAIGESLNDKACRPTPPMPDVDAGSVVTNRKVKVAIRRRAGKKSPQIETENLTPLRSKRSESTLKQSTPGSIPNDKLSGSRMPEALSKHTADGKTLANNEKLLTQESILETKYFHGSKDLLFQTSSHDLKSSTDHASKPNGSKASVYHTYSTALEDYEQFLENWDEGKNSLKNDEWFTVVMQKIQDKETMPEELKLGLENVGVILKEMSKKYSIHNIDGSRRQKNEGSRWQDNGSSRQTSATVDSGIDMSKAFQNLRLKSAEVESELCSVREEKFGPPDRQLKRPPEQVLTGGNSCAGNSAKSSSDRKCDAQVYDDHSKKQSAMGKIFPTSGSSWVDKTAVSQARLGTENADATYCIPRTEKPRHLVPNRHGQPELTSQAKTGKTNAKQKPEHVQKEKLAGMHSERKAHTAELHENFPHRQEIVDKQQETRFQVAPCSSTANLRKSSTQQEDLILGYDHNPGSKGTVGREKLGRGVDNGAIIQKSPEEDTDTDNSGSLGVTSEDSLSLTDSSSDSDSQSYSSDEEASRFNTQNNNPNGHHHEEHGGTWEWGREFSNPVHGTEDNTGDYTEANGYAVGGKTPNWYKQDYYRTGHPHHWQQSGSRDPQYKYDFNSYPYRPYVPPYNPYYPDYWSPWQQYGYPPWFMFNQYYGQYAPATQAQLPRYSHISGENVKMKDLLKCQFDYLKYMTKK